MHKLRFLKLISFSHTTHYANLSVLILLFKYETIKCIEIINLGALTILLDKLQPRNMNPLNHGKHEEVGSISDASI